jgi:hypothetical protein
MTVVVQIPPLGRGLGLIGYECPQCVCTSRACFGGRNEDNRANRHWFDPETTRLLGIAFETAIQALHYSGVDHPPRETIASAKIGFAKAGERDPERLCYLALAACSKPIISDPNPLPPVPTDS